MASDAAVEQEAANNTGQIDLGCSTEYIFTSLTMQGCSRSLSTEASPDLALVVQDQDEDYLKNHPSAVIRSSFSQEKGMR